MRVATIVLVALVFAWPAGSASRPVLTARDLPGIVDPQPVVPKWSFEADDPFLYPVPKHAPAFTLREFLGEDPPAAKKAAAAKLAADGFVIGRHRTWTVKQANYADMVVFAFLFRTVRGATDAVRILGPTRADLRATSLGDEAWKLADDSAVHFFWRRRNLVLIAGVDCSDTTCDFPAVAPARTYAGEVDARARRSA